VSQQQFQAEVMDELAQIEVSFVYPPIPVRSFDYCATFKGYEPGDPIGYGPTEAEAIADLRAHE
jgi:hypothetical protein